MVLPIAFTGPALASLLDSVVVDFVLAFTFFISLCFAILSRRFERQRSAAAMSVALGLALAVGLVAWEAHVGYSVRDFGPLALAIIVVVLTGVVFEAIRQVGGSWSGAAIAAGTAIGIAWLVGLSGALPAILKTIFVILTFSIGIAVLAVHVKRTEPAGPRGVMRVPRTDAAMRDLYRERVLSQRVAGELVEVRRAAEELGDRPEQAGDVLVQLRRILPEAGLLTEQLAQLRAVAHRVRRGHVARIGELQSVIAGLPPERRRELADELARHYVELRFDVRLERLDRAVAENERRIRDLVRQAEQWLEHHEYRRLSGVLDEAARLQRHNAHLLDIIERSQERLLAGARAVRGAHGRGEPWVSYDAAPYLFADAAGFRRMYRSRGEARVGRVLDQYGIPFAYERERHVVAQGRERRWRPDFTLPTYGDLIVEYAGMPDRPDYRAGMDYKQLVYRNNGMPAIFVLPEDLQRMDWPDWLLRRIRRG